MDSIAFVFLAVLLLAGFEYLLQKPRKERKELTAKCISIAAEHADKRRKDC